MRDSELMTIDIVCKGDISVRLEGDNCTVWLSYGLPDYRITIDELQDVLPAVFTELLERKLIKLSK